MGIVEVFASWPEYPRLLKKSPFLFSLLNFYNNGNIIYTQHKCKKKKFDG